MGSSISYPYIVYFYLLSSRDVSYMRYLLKGLESLNYLILVSESGNWLFGKYVLADANENYIEEAGGLLKRLLFLGEE